MMTPSSNRKVICKSAVRGQQKAKAVHNLQKMLQKPEIGQVRKVANICNRRGYWIQ